MTSSAVEVVTEQDLTLFADIDPGGQASSVVPVWWCLSEKMRKLLKDQVIEDAQLLVVVTNGEEETGRYLFGLFDGERYISFTRPGDNTVRAVIVRPSATDSLKDGFFKKLDSGGLACDVVRIRRARTEQLAAKGEDEATNNLFARASRRVKKTEEPAFGIRGAFEFAQCVGSEGKLVVPVASDMFAPEPNPVWRWLSELYRWNSKPKDQCHRRKRAWFTLGTLPLGGPAMMAFFAVCWAVSLVVTGVLLFYGARNINYRPLLHPARAWPDEVWGDLDPSFWFSAQDSDGVYRERTGIAGIVLMLPPICGTFGLIGLAFGATFQKPLWIAFLVWAGFIPVLVAVIFAAALLSKTSGAKILGDWLKRLGGVWNSWQENAELTAHERYEHRLEQLSCDAGPQMTSLTVRRTVVLRFEGAKAWLCKPYAK